MTSSSTIRCYDESVKNYFSGITINDGVNNNRNVQVLFAISSRRGVKLDINKNETPIMPLIVVTRTNLQPSAETNIIKPHITRKSRYEIISTNLKTFNFIESMPYNFHYQIDFFALESEMFNILIEKLFYKLHKYHYVTVNIAENTFNLVDNANIKDFSFSDNTNYNEIENTSNRIFHGTINFVLNGHILNDDSGAKSVLKIENDIKNKSFTGETNIQIEYQPNKNDIENILNKQT